MSNEEDESSKFVRIPVQVIQEIMFQTKWEKRKAEWIADHLKREGFPYSKEEISEMIKRFNKLPASEKKLYRLEMYADKRKRELMQQRQWGFGGGGKSGFGGSPTLIKESFTFKRDETRRTKEDFIRIFTELGCEYCKKAKKEGAHQEQLDNLHKKLGRKFYIYDIEVLTNPIFSVMDKALRIDLQHPITNLGLIPPVFDMYIPMFYIQSPTQEIGAQWRRGINPYKLYDAIMYVVEHKPDPETFFALPSYMHTGSYVSKMSLGVNIKYIKPQKTVII